MLTLGKFKYQVKEDSIMKCINQNVNCEVFEDVNEVGMPLGPVCIIGTLAACALMMEVGGVAMAMALSAA